MNPKFFNPPSVSSVSVDPTVVQNTQKKLSPLALYIHWPFCRAICPYCHFNRYVVDSVDEDAWAKSFITELHYWKNRVGSGHTIVSIFFGGGTPSLMSAQLVAQILETIASLWSLSDPVEITLEMNPTDHTKAADFAAAGINRISMGVQSFHDETLKFLGRAHCVSDIQTALKDLKNVGLRYSFDLIYGHKNHAHIDQWSKELNLACPWIDDHVSLYQLTYEMGTPFYRKRHQELSDDIVLHLESLTENALSPLGLYRYEVSNYARPHAHSVHNRMYWTYQDFLGLGPGAHGRITQRDALSGSITKMATHNAGLPDLWMTSLKEKGHGMILDQALSREQRLQEQILMGLRLREGLDVQALLDPGEFFHNDLIQRWNMCFIEGLLEIPENEIRITAEIATKVAIVRNNPLTWNTESNPISRMDPSLDLIHKGISSSVVSDKTMAPNMVPKRLILTEKGRCVLNSVVDYVCHGSMLIDAKGLAQKF